MALHVPCRRGSTSASLQRTLCAHAPGGAQSCPTHRGGTIATPTGAALALTLVAVFAGARARRQREMASQDSHERLVPPRPRPAALAAWPTPLIPMRRTSPMLRTVVPAGRCGRGGAKRRDGCGFDDGGAPARPPGPAAPRPARVVPWAAPHTAALSQLHVLTPLGLLHSSGVRPELGVSGSRRREQAGCRSTAGAGGACGGHRRNADRGAGREPPRGSAPPSRHGGAGRRCPVRCPIR